MALIKRVNNADSGDDDHTGGNDWDDLSDKLNYQPPSSADWTVYIDTTDANKVKAIKTLGEGPVYSHATDLGNVLNSIHGVLSSTTGGTIRVKSGAYGWATKFSVTKDHVGLFADKGVIVTTTAGFVTDHISVEAQHFHIQNFRFDCTNQGNGNGSWLVVGSTTTSDFLKVYNNYIKSPGTHGIDLQSHCGGAIIHGNQIQSFLAPTGDGLRCASNADHEIIANGIGGFADATNGYGLRLSSCSNIVIMGNRIFVNRINVRLYFAKGIVFTNNLVQAATQTGIHIVNDTASDCGRCIISNNRIHDNSSGSSGTYSGIAIAITSSGKIDNLVITNNMVSDQSVASKTQKYGIEITNGSSLLTNSTIAFNSTAGNKTGSINLGAYNSTNRVFGNTDTLELDTTSLASCESDNGTITGVIQGAAGAVAIGLWQGVTITGTPSVQTLTSGCSRRITAAGAAGDNAGYRNNVVTARRVWGSEYYCRFALSHTNTDLRTFFGYCSSGGAPTGDDWLNALSGIALSVISTNANFRIGKNDGIGATVFVDTGIVTDTATHEFYIKADDTNSRWGWSFDRSALTWETADIPGSTTSLDPIYEIEAVTATAIALDNFKNVIRNRHF